jgi:exodeoxyribonuclease VII large subunit
VRLDLDLEPEPDPTLSVAELHAAVRRIMAPRFNRRIWVRGEVRDLNDHTRSGHLFFSLCDPGMGRRGRDATLRAACWSTTWAGVRRTLQRAGVVLAEGNEVRVGGRVELNDSGQVTLIVEVVDVDALVGRLARERAELCSALREDGLWDANRALPLSPLPLRVGVVGAPGTEGFADFRGVLAASRFGFAVTIAPAVVQGPQAAVSIAAAFRALRLAHERGAELDVVVVIRGGGSQADLAAFDSERVARAIAATPVPVWVGVGHTGDRTVADELAHRSFATPTALAHGLVAEVRDATEQLGDRARRLTRAARSRLTGATDAVARREHRIGAGARGAVRSERRRVVHEALRVEHAARTTIERAGTALASRRERLAPDRIRDTFTRESDGVSSRLDEVQTRARAALRLATSELSRRHAKLEAADPARILRRGFTLTRDPSGAILRDPLRLREGDELVTQFSEGSARSRVVEERR